VNIIFYTINIILFNIVAYTEKRKIGEMYKYFLQQLNKIRNVDFEYLQIEKFKSLFVVLYNLADLESIFLIIFFFLLNRCLETIVARAKSHD